MEGKYKAKHNSRSTWWIRGTLKKRSDQQMEGNDKLKIAIKAHDNRMKNEKRSENV